MRSNHRNQAPSLKKPLRVAAATLALVGSGVGTAEAAASQSRSSQSGPALVEKVRQATRHETATTLDAQWTSLARRVQNFAHSPASTRPDIQLETLQTNYHDGSKGETLSLTSNLYDGKDGIMWEYVMQVGTPDNAVPGADVAPNSLFQISLYESKASQVVPGSVAPAPPPKTVYDFNFGKSADGWQIVGGYDANESFNLSDPVLPTTQSIEKHGPLVHQLMEQANNMIDIVESARAAVGPNFPTHFHPNNQ